MSFFRFNSKGIIWILLGSLNLVNISYGKEDLMWTKSPPLQLLISILRGLWKPGIKNCEFQKDPALFPQYKERLHCLQLIHKDFQTYSVLTLCLSKKKSCYLHFLTRNYGSETENETIELLPKLRTSPFSFSNRVHYLRKIFNQ